MSKRANTNCLTGFRCPECGSHGPFRIAATSLFTIHDDGAWDFGEIEYDDGSYCVCDRCDHDGIVRDFQAEAQP